MSEIYIIILVDFAMVFTPGKSSFSKCSPACCFMFMHSATMKCFAMRLIINVIDIYIFFFPHWNRNSESIRIGIDKRNRKHSNSNDTQP